MSRKELGAPFLSVLLSEKTVEITDAPQRTIAKTPSPQVVRKGEDHRPRTPSSPPRLGWGRALPSIFLQPQLLLGRRPGKVESTVLGGWAAGQAGDSEISGSLNTLVRQRKTSIPQNQRRREPPRRPSGARDAKDAAAAAWERRTAISSHPDAPGRG